MTAPAGIPWDDRGVRLTIPLKTVNESNQRSLSHWPRTKRTKRARGLVALLVPVQLRITGIRPPCVVTLTRISPGKTDDDGNISALKATRDGVADALGVDDGDPRVEWKYEQRKGSRKDLTLAGGYGVEIRIDPAQG
jgi:hypothetical protein